MRSVAVAEKSKKHRFVLHKSPTCEGFLFQKRPRRFFFLEIEPICKCSCCKKDRGESCLLLQYSPMCKGSCNRKDRGDCYFLVQKSLCVKVSCSRKDRGHNLNFAKEHD